jgi:hypothetical protein
MASNNNCAIGFTIIASIVFFILGLSLAYNQSSVYINNPTEVFFLDGALKSIKNQYHGLLHFYVVDDSNTTGYVYTIPNVNLSLVNNDIDYYINNTAIIFADSTYFQWSMTKIEPNLALFVGGIVLAFSFIPLLITLYLYMTYCGSEYVYVSKRTHPKFEINTDPHQSKLSEYDKQILLSKFRNASTNASTNTSARENANTNVNVKANINSQNIIVDVKV